jgi:predicted DCC family thiol-disulfide oxidoreductase YuxK
VDWFDITGREAHLRRIGIDPQEALRELHVRREDGTVLREMDAYILLLRRVPLLRPLARLVERPAVRPLLSRAYRRMVDDRLERTGRLPGRPREGAVHRAGPAGKAAARPSAPDIRTVRDRSGARQGCCGKGEA